MVKETILNTIKKYNLIEPNDTITVAVSGGPDSMCLLDNLIELKQELQIKKIVVAHLNHMIREEAKSETVYVQEYCKNKEIECYVKFVDIFYNLILGAYKPAALRCSGPWAAGLCVCQSMERIFKTRKGCRGSYSSNRGVER